MRLSTRFLALSGAFLLLGLALPAQAATIQVTSLDDEVNTDGDCTLREAVRAANTNAAVDGCAAGDAGTDSITFAATLAAGTITLTEGEIAISESVSIDGETVAGLSRVTVSGGDASRIFNVASGATVELARMTITDGRAENGGAVTNAGELFLADVTVQNSVATGDEPGEGGGGLFNAGSLLLQDGSRVDGNTAVVGLGNGGGILNAEGGTLTLDDSGVVVTMSNNRAARAGGAIETFGDVIASNAVLTGNQADVNGGALHISASGSAAFTGGTVSGNTALGEGGGLWNSSVGTLQVTGTTVSGNLATGNSADQGGGGVYSDGGSTVLVNVTIQSNAATGTSGSGGGILCTGGTSGSGGGILSKGGLSVSGGTITLNTSNRAGGGIEVAAGTASVSDATVSANNAGTAPGNGGGLHAAGGADVSVSGGAFTGNTAVEGGGLWIGGGGVLAVTSSSVTGNTATGNDADKGGGGLYNDGATLTVTNATVSTNVATGTSGSGGGILSNGGTLTVSGGTIADNTSNRAGGGIELAGGAARAGATIGDVAITGNDAGTAPGNGGGIHAGGNVDLVMDGTTLDRNTAVEGGGVWINGGGILTASNVTLTSNTASGDDADKGGGGFYNDGGTATIASSTFSMNAATGTSGSGGGILNNAGIMTVSKTTFDGNTSNRAGGAVEERLVMNTARTAARKEAPPTLQLLSVTMTNNDAGDSPGNGGGLHISGMGRVVVDSSDVRDNDAGSEGGGLWNSGAGSLTVTATTLRGNSADVSGGGLYQSGGADGALIVRNSLLVGNTSAGRGGGLGADGATFYLVNTTVSDNEAPIGGGISSSGARGLLSSVTVARNVARQVGGGLASIVVDGETDGVVHSLDNTIVADNTAPASPDIAGFIESRGWNLFETTVGATVEMEGDTDPATDQTGVDPRLGPLADNGGATLSHALLGGSPAIDAGQSSVMIDQRGFDRPEMVRHDIGAIEAEASANGLIANPVAGDDGPDGQVEPLVMESVYPNPVSGLATLAFTLRDAQPVQAGLYDALGRRVIALYEGTPAASSTIDIEIDASSLAPGVYVLRVTGDGIAATQRMTVLR